MLGTDLRLGVAENKYGQARTTEGVTERSSALAEICGVALEIKGASTTAFCCVEPNK